MTRLLRRSFSMLCHMLVMFRQLPASRHRLSGIDSRRLHDCMARFASRTPDAWGEYFQVLPGWTRRYGSSGGS